MALIHGNKPFGDPDIGFGSTGGTFGNLWPNGEPQTDGVIADGTAVDVTTDVIWPLADVVIANGAVVELNFIQVFRYFGSPVKVAPVLAVGPTAATLRKASME